jgi:hypothetical protein
VQRRFEFGPVRVAAALDLGEAGDERGATLRDEPSIASRCASMLSPLAPWCAVLTRS